MISHAEPVMGTVVSFLVDPGALEPSVVEGAVRAACSELHRLDLRFSAWRDDSELSTMRGANGPPPSPLMQEVMDLCGVACEETHGLFDPWALPGGFDPTGLVKGWAAERALAIVVGVGVESALVNAGGDVAVHGSPQGVGVRHPRRPDALCAVVSVASAVATSGTYERGDHLTHPFGFAVSAVSATVVGGRLALCDAWATALAVGGAEALFLLEQLPQYEAFFITEDEKMYTTRSMAFAHRVDVVA